MTLRTALFLEAWFNLSFSLKDEEENEAPDTYETEEIYNDDALENDTIDVEADTTEESTPEIPEPPIKLTEYPKE